MTDGQQPSGAWATARAELASLARIAGAALTALWRVVRGPLVGVLNVLAALVVLFEEWGWRPLADLLGLLARLRVVARLELWIAGLPPYAALLVFALPTTILLPVKLVGLWLLAQGQALLAGGVLVLAKIASTALVARIFMLTKPALMRIGWFASAYNRFMPWKEALFARIRASWAWRYGRMVKTAIRQDTRKMWLRWRPWLVQHRDAWQLYARSRLIAMRLQARNAWRNIRARVSE